MIRKHHFYLFGGLGHRSLMSLLIVSLVSCTGSTPFTLIPNDRSRTVGEETTRADVTACREKALGIAEELKPVDNAFFWLMPLIVSGALVSSAFVIEYPQALLNSRSREPAVFDGTLIISAVLMGAAVAAVSGLMYWRTSYQYWAHYDEHFKACLNEKGYEVR